MLHGYSIMLDDCLIILCGFLIMVCGYLIYSVM